MGSGQAEGTSRGREMGLLTALLIAANIETHHSDISSRVTRGWGALCCDITDVIAVWAPGAGEEDGHAEWIQPSDISARLDISGG